MEKIIVSLKGRNYPIVISDGLFNNSIHFWPLKRGDNVMLITSFTVASLYLEIIKELLIRLGVKVNQIILPDGEKYKSLSTVDHVITSLLKNYYNRNSILIALGGGVIGDLTGFIASIYQRGIRLIQIPTTLLSQVDSSVGGKTAVNHLLGKNMIGSFYQPVSVIIDVNCLKTLSHREFSSGLAEVIKYSIIFDIDFFSWLEENLDSLIKKESKALSYCIRRCCQIKANIVAIDEKEHNVRALLNFGHTYGHAIEAHVGYGNWLHGEAIAVGMMMAIMASYRLGYFSNTELDRVKSLLLRAGLPINGPIKMIPENYFSYMIRDKKVINNNICLILPLKIGEGKICTSVSIDIIKSSILDCII